MADSSSGVGQCGFPIVDPLYATCGPDTVAWDPVFPLAGAPPPPAPAPA